MLATCVHTGTLLSLFDCEDGGDMRSSETLADFEQTTRHYIPEHNTLRELFYIKIIKCVNLLNSVSLWGQEFVLAE
jgi:hypothetical protein